MFTARVASEPGGRMCATARKVGVQHPTFFTFTPPLTPRGPLSAMATRWRPSWGKFRCVSAGYAPTPLHGDPRER
eukprot:6609019-Prymnesium_polylepis.1